MGGRLTGAVALVLAVLAVLAALPAGARAAQGRWAAESEVLAPAAAGDAHLALLPNGTVTAAWVERRDGALTVMAADRPRGGPLGISRRLATLAEGSSPFVAIAAAGDGTTVVAWRDGDRADPLGQFATRLQVAIRPPGGAFGSPVTLFEGATQARVVDGVPIAAAGADGTIAVGMQTFELLSQTPFFSTAMRFAVRPPGGAFGVAQLAAEGTAGLNATAVAVGPTGAVLAGWQLLTGPPRSRRRPCARPVARSARRTPSAS